MKRYTADIGSVAKENINREQNGEQGKRCPRVPKKAQDNGTI